jgi:cell shape-determining protein MreD
MKTRLLKIILPVLPYNLLLPAVVLFDLRGEKNVYWWAFWAGLVSDLIIGRTLGFSSLFYLLVLTVNRLVRTRQPFRFWHAIFMILLFDGIYARLPF